MAIRLEQPGLATLYGTLATLVGQAEAGRRTQQLALETAERARSREHELATMQMRAEYEIEGERRSHEWELEKAEIASRNDFMEEERKRLTKHQEYDAAMKAIDKTDSLSPKEKEDFKLQYELRERTGYTPESRVMFPEAYKTPTSQLQESIAAIIGGQTVGGVAEKATAPGIAPMYAKNPATGQRLVSNDNGALWQPVQ